MFLLGALADFGDTAVKGYEHFVWLGPEYLGRQLGSVGLYGLAMWSANERFHAVFAVTMLLYNVSWILRFYPSFS